MGAPKRNNVTKIQEDKSLGRDSNPRPRPICFCNFVRLTKVALKPSVSHSCKQTLAEAELPRRAEEFEPKAFRILLKSFPAMG